MKINSRIPVAQALSEERWQSIVNDVWTYNSRTCRAELRIDPPAEGRTILDVITTTLKD